VVDLGQHDQLACDIDRAGAAVEPSEPRRRRRSSARQPTVGACNERRSRWCALLATRPTSVRQLLLIDHRERGIALVPHTPRP
jgi:hypothetical protein